MKRIITTIVLSITILNISHAQLNIGLKLNWNINKFLIYNTDANQEFYNRGIYDIKALTLGGGIITNYKINKYFSLQSELIYSPINTGFSKVEYYTNLQNERDAIGNGFQVKMHYLEIPLLAKVSFGNKVTFDILAGAFVGYLLSGKQSTDNGKLTLPVDTIYNWWQGEQHKIIDFPTHNARTDYTSFNAGIAAGLAVTMHDRMMLEFRLNRGLVNINKSGSAKMNTLQAQFSVGYYIFRQKKKA